ncbi:PHP domain-containing protein, partial [Propionibacterium freudenreichii]|nr:PHP domain-containing protein [Propionibacterium freudenreichii]
MPAFVHLRVASSYSLQYGASHPEELVAGAAAAGMTMLGLTDRDGLYGAVRFVQACQQANISPIVGVDLAVELCGVPDGARRVRPVPVKGGS